MRENQTDSGPKRVIAPLKVLADDLAAPASVASALVAGHVSAEVVVFVADAAAPLVAVLLGHRSASSSAGALFLVAAGAFVVPCLAVAEVSPAVAGIFDRVSGSQYWGQADDS